MIIFCYIYTLDNDFFKLRWYDLFILVLMKLKTIEQKRKSMHIILDENNII